MLLQYYEPRAPANSLPAMSRAPASTLPTISRAPAHASLPDAVTRTHQQHTSSTTFLPQATTRTSPRESPLKPSRALAQASLHRARTSSTPFPL